MIKSKTIVFITGAYVSHKSKISVTEFMIKERNHFVLGLPTWKADAEYIMDWIRKN